MKNSFHTSNLTWDGKKPIETDAYAWNGAYAWSGAFAW